MKLRKIAAATLLALLVSACGPSGTPESQVRAVIARGEVAAEARDISGVMDLVSPTFQDGRGGSRDDLKQYLRGYFVTHQSIHLLMRVNSVEFPYSDMAKVSLTLGTLGRESDGTSTLDLAADVHDVELELQREGGEWRVTRASWQSARGQG
jgi:hypothetical protein